MTKRSAGIVLALAAVLGRAATGFAGDWISLPSDQEAHEAERDQGGKVVVRFEGGDVNRELALALLTLHDLKLLPTESMERYAVAKAGPWQAIREKTDLPAACPPEMQHLLRRPLVTG